MKKSGLNSMPSEVLFFNFTKAKKEFSNSYRLIFINAAAKPSQTALVIFSIFFLPTYSSNSFCQAVSKEKICYLFSLLQNTPK